MTYFRSMNCMMTHEKLGSLTKALLMMIDCCGRKTCIAGLGVEKNWTRTESFRGRRAFLFMQWPLNWLLNCSFMVNASWFLFYDKVWGETSCRILLDIDEWEVGATCHPPAAISTSDVYRIVGTDEWKSRCNVPPSGGKLHLRRFPIYGHRCSIF